MTDIEIVEIFATGPLAPVDMATRDSHPSHNLSTLILRLLFLTGLVSTGLAQVDDFSCPDEFEGFYPHLYR